ncbi:MAG: LemA family protein [Candidatus Heimdallarchaeaceae archaeon]
MKKGLAIFLGIVAVLIVIVLVVGGYLVGQYNSMVDLEQDVENAQAQVEVVLQRRFDLIPNLVESVKGAMKQEQEVFLAIAEARTRYSGAETGSSDKLDAANEYESAIGRLLVIIENYPEVKSNEQVTGLMDELAGTENRISVERQRYNNTATNYNKYIKKFPGTILASLFGFDEKDLFEAAEGADIAPEVQF